MQKIKKCQLKLLTYTPQGYIITVKLEHTEYREETEMEKECCKRIKKRSSEEYERLIHRLNRIEGQIRGIRKMVEQDAYCADILVQSAAVNAALNSFSRELLSNHIKSCVVADIRKGNEEKTDELISLLKKWMR